MFYEGGICTPSKKCFVYNDTRYTIYDGVVTWYDAVSQCSRRDEKLAVISEYKRAEILKRVSAKVKPNAWIGLHQKEYYIDLCQLGNKYMKYCFRH